MKFRKKVSLYFAFDRDMLPVCAVADEKTDRDRCNDLACSPYHLNHFEGRENDEQKWTRIYRGYGSWPVSPLYLRIFRGELYVWFCFGKREIVENVYILWKCLQAD